MLSIYRENCLPEPEPLPPSEFRKWLHGLRIFLQWGIGVVVASTMACVGPYWIGKLALNRVVRIAFNEGGIDNPNPAYWVVGVGIIIAFLGVILIPFELGKSYKQ